MNLRRIGTPLLLAGLVAACGGADEEYNAFLEDWTSNGKEDTAYYNPDGIEVEVDLEADVEASSYQIFEAPAQLGQYALTYLRKNGQFYLESLAEDASSDQRVEWQIDGVWKTAAEARSAPVSKLRHFRIRGVNAVLLQRYVSGAAVGKVFTAKVPLKPYSVFADAGNTCADPDDHMDLDATIYWYMWNPKLSGCKIATQDMSVTISRMFPQGKVTYPEYDRLTSDGRITAVVLFGQIGDGAISDSDPGMSAYKTMARNLKSAKFTEVTPAPVGKRFRKTFGSIEFEIDLYSPRDFSGLGDFAHFSNFQRALSEHEIVVYDGHSMLGASDFWERPTYPSFYQIFLYGGCLGYEYYVRPILAGKGGWQNVDIMSSVVEVSANANEFAAPVLSKIQYTLTRGYKITWKDLLQAVRNRVGDSTFGVSGVRDNCFSPAGSLCGTPPDPNTSKRYENTTSASIPDNASAGVSSAIEVSDSMTIASLSLELDISHTYIGDLRVTLSHGGKTATVWDQDGGSRQNISQAFALDTWKGLDARGTWTLKVVDTYAQDTGTLNRWALVITP